MKGRNIAFIIVLIVLADQALKFYIKTHFVLNEFHNVAGNWFKLLFIENEGMAYGWKFGGGWGKMILTLFRLFAVIFGVWYIKDIIKKKQHPGFIICVGLIFAGALGNLIDSMFYGLIFEESSPLHVAALFPKEGYAGFMHGRVVDMLYFPIIRTHLPTWVPIWGDTDFEFFQPIFNLADASISTGVIALLVFQKKFFRQQNPVQNHPTEESPIPAGENQPII
ncbi:lipoprotein signal peptidase [Ferruginibacter albus]|uniref:lipoprotein signal peptidase n=1 Tax=Ferruginibacter albus TaxID=2875540 RepID=UPI001CC771C5|nr:lipoprotein signal peptidase [Ferruginibacter albus]UAY52791.1 lipoprotein signal peptidase [Ferruginibacter albus]